MESKAKKTICIGSVIELDAISHSLSSESIETVFEFIKELDIYMSDRDFTAMCYNYFKKEVKENNKNILI